MPDAENRPKVRTTLIKHRKVFTPVEKQEKEISLEEDHEYKKLKIKIKKPERRENVVSPKESLPETPPLERQESISTQRDEVGRQQRNNDLQNPPRDFRNSERKDGGTPFRDRGDRGDRGDRTHPHQRTNEPRFSRQGQDGAPKSFEKKGQREYGGSRDRTERPPYNRQGGNPRFSHTGSGPYNRNSTGSGPYNRNSTGSGPYNRNSTGSGPYNRNSTGSGSYNRNSTGSGPYNRNSTGSGPHNRNSTGSGPYNRNNSGPHNRTGTGPYNRTGAGGGGSGGPHAKYRVKPSGQGQVPAGGGQTRRTFKATRKKQQFVHRKKQFEDRERQLTIREKKQDAASLANPVPRYISIMESISVVDLAKKMNLKASELLSKLMSMGVMGNLNTIIDYETAQLLAGEYDCEVNVISLYEQTLIESPEDKEEDRGTRPPVVTIMGHVDHGKTTLLDAIRNSDIVKNEQGNITQHIGAYMVGTPHGKITFLDTPGHEAFSLMRERGANLTDIIVLVIAADDGIMPQTIESINYAKKSAVPIIVALNKVDSHSVNIDRVMQQLTEQELMPEEWGGTIPVCKISALKNEGIDNLLEHIILQSELIEITANNVIPAQGVVLETRMEHGKGVVVSVLIKKGILKTGDSFVSGIYHGKVRGLSNDKKKNIKDASPGMPVEVIGIDGMPGAGDPFQVTENDKAAKQISTKRQELARFKAGENISKVTADTLYESIEKESVDILNVIVKGDVHGSVEAIKESLEKLSNDEIKVKVIHASAGNINAADVSLATTSDALVIGFHVRPSQQVQRLAHQEKVTISRFIVIFDIIDAVKQKMSGMLSPIVKEEKIGEATIRELFTIPKFGVIAGAYIDNGKVEKDSVIKVMRKGKEIHSGRVVSLKRFKDDVNKVETGYECGIAVGGTDNLQPQDVFHVYKEVAVQRTL